MALPRSGSIFSDTNFWLVEFFWTSAKWFSASENRIYDDPNNCSDCELIIMSQNDLDACGGKKVADGDASTGNDYR